MYMYIYIYICIYIYIYIFPQVVHHSVYEKQDEMGSPLGKDGCRQTNKESRGGNFFP